ncbi:MAG: hypothetical protein WBU92_10490 [Candidatus Dormiibacterota bacterium]
MVNSGDLWIKVPGPFWGVDTVGFSVRYPLGPDPDPGSAVPFLVEGDAPLMGKLGRMLRLFAQRELFVDCQEPGEAYSWSEPIPLSDQLVVMSFRDRSMDGGGDPVRAVRNRLANQLVPLAFPFLRDCVRVARLRLDGLISVRLVAGSQPEIELSLPLEKIGVGNGDRSLAEL